MDLLSAVRAPTLVLHAQREDRAEPRLEAVDKLGVWTHAQAIVFARDRDFRP
jgi:hypothetical protein